MTDGHKPKGSSLLSALFFLFGHIGLVVWSFVLVAVTGFFTWLGYLEAVKLISSMTGSFFQSAPVCSGILGWFECKGWIIMKFVFVLITRITSFYLAFLLAYCITSPGYVFLSGATEKKYAVHNRRLNPYDREKYFFDRAKSKISIILTDFVEGIKIGLLGIFVTIIAIVVNFIPVIGQIMVFLIYVFYSALMFIDYPASNRHWNLKQKIKWTMVHYRRSFRIGVLPALVSMIPVINIMLMALLFPLFTVHTTLNFIMTEQNA